MEDCWFALLPETHIQFVCYESKKPTIKKVLFQKLSSQSFISLIGGC